MRLRCARGGAGAVEIACKCLGKVIKIREFQFETFWYQTLAKPLPNPCQTIAKPLPNPCQTPAKPTAKPLQKPCQPLANPQERPGAPAGRPNSSPKKLNAHQSHPQERPGAPTRSTLRAQERPGAPFQNDELTKKYTPLVCLSVP